MILVRLSPGMFLVTCACSNKKIYGFIMMIMHESPRLIFDIITTRFPLNYNPKWIYDAACRAKELGLNREPRRMMETLFCTDPVHVDNHTRCLESYSSTEYRSLHALNKEACEQFNSVLLKGHRINSGLHDIRSLPGLLWLDCGDFLRSSGTCMKILEYDLEENKYKFININFRFLFKYFL